MTADQFWSIFAMPIGVALCFGPAIVAWLAAERQNPPSDEKADPPRASHGEKR